MSVPASKRSLSDREFYHNAIAIRVEVTKLMTRERVIPKAYRFVLSVPTVQTAKDLVDHITVAETFYPNTPHGVNQRRHYLTLALGDVYRLVQDLQTAKDVGLPINLNLFDGIAGMLDREIALLKGARKNVRLIGGEGPAKEAERLREELAELEAMLED